MAFRDYVRYDWLLISDAFKRTRHLVAPNWLVPACIFSVGIVVHFVMFGEVAAIGELSWALSGATAVLLIGCIVFIWNVGAAPYRFWKRGNQELKIAHAKIVKLQNFIDETAEPGRHNVTLVDAVYYVAFGRWDVASVIDESKEYIDNPTQNKLRSAIDEVRHEALSGELPIWGESNDSKQNILFEKIEDPREYWKVYWPPEEYFKYNSPQDAELDQMFDEYADVHEGHCWYYTSKQAVEKRWPPEDILA